MSTEAVSSPTVPPLTTEPVTLVVEDQESGNPGLDRTLDTLNTEFMAAHPNITIDRVKVSFDDLQAKQKLELSGPNPPDVTELAIPYPTIAEAVKQGLLLNLDPYDETYGWSDRFAPSLFDLDRWDSTGAQTKGSLYATYQAVDVVGLFYNKEKLKALGLEVPATFEDLQAALVAAKGAGEIPMMLGNLDKWPAIHAMPMTLNRYVGVQAQNDWVFHLAPATFDDQAHIDAMTLYQSWAQQRFPYLLPQQRQL